MHLNLNQPETVTHENVAKLLASADDLHDTQLRCSVEGIVHLAYEDEFESKTGVLFRIPTWNAGEGYVGAGAAADTAWVRRIHAALMRNWPTPLESVIEP